jgi:phosphatidylinositol glycan class P protein
MKVPLVVLDQDDQLAKQSDVTVGGYAVPPSTEYFGFALYLGSGFTFLVYLLWTTLPRFVLCDWLGVCYYPSRWWGLVVPCYIGVAVAYVYVALSAYNVECLTRDRKDLNIVTDSVAVVVTSANNNNNSSTSSNPNTSIGFLHSNHSNLAPIGGNGHRRGNSSRRGRRGAGGELSPISATPPTSPSRLRHERSGSSGGFGSGTSDLATINPYLFKPSDGVWDLPLSQVCHVLYANKPSPL